MTPVGPSPRCEVSSGNANLYPYVGNSPTNYVDPSGLCEDPVEFDEFAQRQHAMFQDRGDQLFNSLSLFLRNEYLSKYGISPWDRGPVPGL